SLNLPVRRGVGHLTDCPANVPCPSSSFLSRPKIGCHRWWADVLTNIAAEDPCSYRCAQFPRYSSAMLDRQVRDALPAVDSVVRSQGSCRAGGDTQTARTTIAHKRLIRLELKRRQDLSEQHPGSEPFGQHIGILAIPPQA